MASCGGWQKMQQRDSPFLLRHNRHAHWNRVFFWLAVWNLKRRGLHTWKYSSTEDMQVTTANDVKVYNLSAGKSLPEVRMTSIISLSLNRLCSGCQRERDAPWSKMMQVNFFKSTNVSVYSLSTQTWGIVLSWSRTSRCPQPPPTYSWPTTVAT